MIIKNYLAYAFDLARRRRSPWNLALATLMLIAWPVIWWLLFRFIWRFHELLYPQHAGLLHEFWPSGVAIAAFASSFLMVFGPAAPAMGISLLVANTIVWSIAPARRALETEVAGYPGADFRSAQKGIMRFTLATLAIGLLLALLGAATLRSLR